MMELAYSSLKLVGIKDITIEVSSRIFFDTFMIDIKKCCITKRVKKIN